MLAVLADVLDVMVADVAFGVMISQWIAETINTNRKRLLILFIAVFDLNYDKK